MNTLMLLLDLAGGLVFGRSGAMAGVRHKLDIFGVLALAYVTANAAGIGRARTTTVEVPPPHDPAP